MPHSEKLLQRETLGKNRVFTHERWHVRLENGRTAEREIIRHPGGVGIVAVDENGRLLMVRQYRSGMGCEALEIPAGKRDPGETPEQCGRRELEEECGFIAGRLELLAALLSGDQHTFETFRCEAPELVHLPQATYEWYCRNYLDRDYPFRMLLRCNGVTFPDRKEA